MLVTHTIGFTTMPPIVFCSFVFRVVGFIIDDFKKNRKYNTSIYLLTRLKKQL